MIVVTGSAQARPETFDQVRDLCIEHTRRFQVPASNAFMREVRKLAAGRAGMKIYQADEVAAPA